MADYGMVIDLTKCVRCRTCYVACKISNEIPAGVHGKIRPQTYRRLWLLESEYGSYPMVRRIFVPVPCMHCKEPICKEVCPTEAIYFDDNGVVKTDYSKCTLCLRCVYSCPYRARVYWPNLGLVDSCDFCSRRNYKPFCSEMCPARAIVFGDLSDPNGDVLKILERGLAKQIIIENFKVKPKVYYIFKHEEDIVEASRYLKSKMREER